MDGEHPLAFASAVMRRAARRAHSPSNSAMTWNISNSSVMVSALTTAPW
jgi:hypothetical protein